MAHDAAGLPPPPELRRDQAASPPSERRPVRHTYGAIGSETDLQRRGLVNGGLLDPFKARVLLRLLLAAGTEKAEVAEAFASRG